MNELRPSKSHKTVQSPPSREYIKPARLASLDIGRMFAAFIVVIYHGDVELTGGRTPIINQGNLGVTFFMVLSGYVLAIPYFENKADPDKKFEFVPYLKRRIVRIVPPYYFIVAVSAFFTAVGMGSKQHLVAPGTLYWHIIAHLLFIHNFFRDTYFSLMGALWSLGLEWQYYLLFPVLLYCIRRYANWLVLAGAIVLSLVLRALVLRYRPDMEIWVWGVSVFRLPEFAFGMLFSYALSDRKNRLPVPALAAAAALCCVVGWVFPSLWLKMLTEGAAFFLLLMALRFWGPKAAKTRPLALLQFLGVASYSTYLIHALSGKFYVMLLRKLAPEAAAHSTVLALAGYVILGHLAGVTLFYLVERPLTQFMGVWLKVSPNRTVKSGF